MPDLHHDRAQKHGPCQYVSSVLSTTDAGSDGWRRYVALMIDAIAVNERLPLPPAAALRYEVDPNSWPLQRLS